MIDDLTRWYRKTTGPTHDGDCHVYALGHICTCGLLHALQRLEGSTDPETVVAIADHCEQMIVHQMALWDAEQRALTARARTAPDN